MARRRARNSGTVRQLPSGRWQARYRDEDDRLCPAPMTFDTKLDASAWLTDYADGEVDLEQTKRQSVPTFEAFAVQWLAAGGRRGHLKPRTVELYQDLLDDVLVPEFGKLRLTRITPTRVRTWYASMDPTKPTRRRHAYGLLASILSTAVLDDLLEVSPCKVEGAATPVRAGETRVATLDQLDVIVKAMPERYRVMVLLAAWCALRFGELAELRRGDIDLEAGTIRVDRAVVRTSEGPVVGDPKSAAGRRTVAIPPHLLPEVKAHLRRHVGAGSTSLLFPARSGGTMSPSALYTVFYPARDKAGRPDLRFHDLRHTGAYLAAGTGASLADLMARLGHSTTRAAMVYQHPSQERDRAIAEGLSAVALAKVLPITKSRSRTASGK